MMRVRDAARGEYRALVDGLPSLMHEFECSISPAGLAEVATLMTAIECIDRLLDPIPLAPDRTAFSQAVLAAVAGHEVLVATVELATHLRALHAVLVRRHLTAPFTAIAARALANTEQMRTTTNRSEFLDCVELEGHLMVELALLVIGPWANARFVEFLQAVASVANLIDKLLDVRGDHRRGELVVRPGVRLHARLVARLARRVPHAARRYPSLWRFVAWGVGWLRPPAITVASRAARTSRA